MKTVLGSDREVAEFTAKMAKMDALSIPTGVQNMSTETGTGLIIVYGDSLESVEAAILRLEKRPDCIRTAQECWFQPLEVQHPALRAYLCQNIVTFFRFTRTQPLVAVPAFWISDKELAEVRRDFPGAQILDARDEAEQEGFCK